MPFSLFSLAGVKVKNTCKRSRVRDLPPLYNNLAGITFLENDNDKLIAFSSIASIRLLDLDLPHSYQILTR